MPLFEYKVVPAPAKGTKAKGVKSPEGRFALSVEELLNEMAALGWEFQRAELLPSEEKSGLASTTVNWRNLLVFRRLLDVAQPPLEGDADDLPPAARPLPGPMAPPDPRAEAPPVAAPRPISEETRDPQISAPTGQAEDSSDLPPFASNRNGDAHSDADTNDAEVPDRSKT
ncbi:hypothetical protein SAMN05444007_102353 [Cribrihabitans marinus]|uniref:DUF4177 domain-containing protein n=1 Tax=Cribrihabitans marinus TaxID=1227549 RepID=A0A1H6TKS2_9RHOB|nr:DUF4177 domain-containing protein [Cribrihabitans marinus]GGH21867.1 hypothetical protein GCM10010973_06730 [Cribrihabitans marinus]SEI78764.1 hypothetical protein SAMN05444007_102353 [Cribrihabitans marinus]